MKGWAVAAAAAATLLFGVALSREIYDATSPPALSWHVLLRKGYSIVAFAVVAFCLRKALAHRLRDRSAVVVCAAALAVYSALIEFGQAIVGAREGLAWNAFDVACGAAGGALGAALAAVTPRTPEPPQR